MRRNRKHATWLDLAARTAKKGVRRGHGGPFGAVIVCRGKKLVMACNTVLKTKDPTCHAEINAIRKAAQKRRSMFFRDCVIYSTTEPCPMCFSAIHWARFKKIIYATTIHDVQILGFNEMPISAQSMKVKGKSRIKIERFEHPGCRELLMYWKKFPSKKTY